MEDNCSAMRDMFNQLKFIVCIALDMSGPTIACQCQQGTDFVHYTKYESNYGISHYRGEQGGRPKR